MPYWKFKPRTIYTVLGLLNEYGGRRIAFGYDLIEWFYPSEEAVADVFERYLNLLAEENNLQTKIMRVVVDGRIYFYSAEVAELINSYYLNNLSWKENGTYTVKGKTYQSNSSRISGEAFYDPTATARTFPDAQLSYLVGAYYRFGRRNAFTFANAYHKVLLVMDFLILIGSKRVAYVAPPRRDLIPTINTVKFASTAKTQKYFVGIERQTI